MRIPINYTDDHQLHITLIEIYNPILKLKRREKEVLVHYLGLFKELYLTGKSDKEIAAEMFSTKVRQDFRAKTSMSEPSYNNHIFQLKHKKVLIEGELNPTLKQILKVRDYELTYSPQKA